VTQDLEQHIKRELYTKRFFTIPDLGSIHLKREAAKFSEDKSIIYPPNFHIVFSKQTTTSIDVNPKFQGALLSLSTRITEELNLHNKSKIRGLGVFQKEDEKIKFYPEKELEKSFSIGLEPIYGVSEVSKKFSGSPTIKGETLVVSKSKTDYSRLIKIAKTAAWVIIGLGLLYALFNIPINLSDDNIPVVKQKPVAQKETIIPSDSSQEFIDTLDIATEKPIIETQIEEKPTEKKQAEETVAKNVPTADSEIKKANQKIKNTKPYLPRPDTNQISTLTGKPCAIITGSFKSAIYSIRMIKRLQKLGYKVYTEENDSTTRVGLLYNCNNENEVDLLAKIKSTVDTSSWILQ
jgi:cell division septation protein DedD